MQIHPHLIMYSWVQSRKSKVEQPARLYNKQLVFFFFLSTYLFSLTLTSSLYDNFHIFLLICDLRGCERERHSSVFLCGRKNTKLKISCPAGAAHDSHFFSTCFWYHFFTCLKYRPTSKFLISWLNIHSSHDSQESVKFISRQLVP